MPFNPRYEPAVSTARLATYRAIADSDDHAWALYRWNIDLAAAFTPLACDVEVALRNTIHDRLAAHLGPGADDADSEICPSFEVGFLGEVAIVMVVEQLAQAGGETDERFAEADADRLEVLNSHTCSRRAYASSTRRNTSNAHVSAGPGCRSG